MEKARDCARRDSDRHSSEALFFKLELPTVSYDFKRKRALGISLMLSAVILLTLTPHMQIEASTITEHTLPTVDSSPLGIFVSDRLAYFTEFWGNKISCFDPSTGMFTEWIVPTCNSQPRSLVVSGSSVYFTEQSGNKIGRLDLATGMFTEWTIPTSDSRPIGIHVNNGLIYFTE